MARSLDPDAQRLGDALFASEPTHYADIDDADLHAEELIALGVIPPPVIDAAWDVSPGTSGALNLRHVASTRRLKPSNAGVWGPDWGPVLYDMAARLNETSVDGS